MNEYVKGNRRAFEVQLPPGSERPNKATIAAVARWNMTLPGDHAFWNRYSISCCSLADFPGVPAAYKKSPEMTHEVQVMAIDPEFPEKDFNAGGIKILTPINLVCQFKGTDQLAINLVRFLASGFVEGRLIAEPEGIQGARELFDNAVKHFVSEE